MVSADRIDEAVVESVMLDLMGPQVEIIRRFNRPLRDEYMHNLRTMVHESLVRAFDPDARAAREKGNDVQ